MSTPQNTQEILTEALAIAVWQLKSLAEKGFNEHESNEILTFAAEAMDKAVAFAHHNEPKASLAAGIEIVNTYFEKGMTA